jgi:uncharacterized protein HemX
MAEHYPMTATQLAGHATSTIVGGLTPAMLGVLLLNVIGVAAAVYFLNLLISGQQQHLKSLLEVQQQQMDKVLTVTQSQMTQVLRTHDREFDALMGMIQQANLEEPPREFLPPPRPPVGGQ